MLHLPCDKASVKQVSDLQWEAEVWAEHGAGYRLCGTRPVTPYLLSPLRSHIPERVAVVSHTVVAGRASGTADEAKAHRAQGASRHPFARRPPPPRPRLRRRSGRGLRWGLASELSALLQARSGRCALGWR